MVRPWPFSDEGISMASHENLSRAGRAHADDHHARDNIAEDA